MFLSKGFQFTTDQQVYLTFFNSTGKKGGRREGLRKKGDSKQGSQRRKLENSKKEKVDKLCDRLAPLQITHCRLPS